jgi:hypothetical protein
MDAINRIMLELVVNTRFASQAVNQEADYSVRLKELGVNTYPGIDFATKHIAEAGPS